MKKTTVEQRALILKGATLRIKGLSRDLKKSERDIREQIEINRKLHYDLHNKKMECDHVIAQQQARIEDQHARITVLIKECDEYSDKVVAREEQADRLKARLDAALEQGTILTGTRDVLMKSNQALTERCDKLDMRVDELIGIITDLAAQ